MINEEKGMGGCCSDSGSKMIRISNPSTCDPVTIQDELARVWNLVREIEDKLMLPTPSKESSPEISSSILINVRGRLTEIGEKLAIISERLNILGK